MAGDSIPEKFATIVAKTLPTSRKMYLLDEELQQVYSLGRTKIFIFRKVKIHEKNVKELGIK